jgi:CBS domain-containing protein
MDDLNLNLPEVSADTKVSMALRAMRDAKRSGVIVTDAGERSIYTADELLDRLHRVHELAAARATADGAKVSVSLFDQLLMKDLEPRVVGVTIPMESAQLEGFGSTHRALDAVLTSRGAKYAAIDTGGSQFRLVFRSADFVKHLLLAPTMCVCDTDPDHCWRPTDLNTNGHCKLDDSDVKCS